MILELHLLQSFPVSNLNRDDLGQPKTATFGGVPRARISSQSLKRAARDEFDQHGLDAADLGQRTKRLELEVTKLLSDPDHGYGRAAEATSPVVAAAFNQFRFKTEATGFTKYLLFVDKNTARLLAEFCNENWDALSAYAAKAQKEREAKEAKKSKKTTSTGDSENPVEKIAKIATDSKLKAIAKDIFSARRAADIALFGRMIADNTDLNVNAASQVAHAISTHAVATEFDYYTAVDDLKRDDEPGADMIGTIDFNTACYYSYANLNLAQLTENLQGDHELVAQAAKAWLGAFIHSTPSGKQTTTAARTMPETLLGTVRTRGAWNLANAFLRPVTGTDVLGSSTKRLFAHFQTLRAFYGTTDLRTVAGAALSCSSDPLPAEDTVADVNEFTNRLLTTALDAA
ncbi:type I-E CRISPR-associated protein Cas7/Cse4/CasC [Saccharopolyspora subtropica]|uniref:Type I-E CRISPR-associated protein Cas7/Cse4/CasC n=1 Tax=Saccharopolyspora thermophila TaxID=89367 RepID=A0A917K3T8_9PSEU|nr:type I-E CRISPR-associated protein Cas7/Cse4/CasC [Saccharopolyspora subtropica]GGI97880.1 type I-E CRISPR-associated protein Cas7/Cse4/CasC [Saccharopolyspora subtropica]